MQGHQQKEYVAEFSIRGRARQAANGREVEAVNFAVKSSLRSRMVQRGSCIPRVDARSAIFVLKKKIIITATISDDCRWRKWKMQGGEDSRGDMIPV